tara:strand:+ start:195 stop:449 length:255 start_codon:yes stop_codon:yes gene_type:complete
LAPGNGLSILAFDTHAKGARFYPKGMRSLLARDNLDGVLTRDGVWLPASRIGRTIAMKNYSVASGRETVGLEATICVGSENYPD